MPTPSTRRQATCSNSRRVQRSPLYAVPVFVLSVPLQTVQRYRCRRPDVVANEPWPTMFRPGFPRLSHPGLVHALPAIALIAQVYGGLDSLFHPRSRSAADRSTANGANTRGPPRQACQPCPRLLDDHTLWSSLYTANVRFNSRVPVRGTPIPSPTVAQRRRSQSRTTAAQTPPARPENRCAHSRPAPRCTACPGAGKSSFHTDLAPVDRRFQEFPL